MVFMNQNTGNEHLYCNTHNIKHLCLTALAAILSACALLSPAVIPPQNHVLGITDRSENFFLATLAKLRLATADSGLLGAFVVIVLFVVFSRFLNKSIETKKKPSICAMVLSALFSLMMIVGMSIKNFENLDFILGSRFQIMYALLLFIGFECFFYVCIEILFGWLDSRLNLENLMNHQLSMKTSKFRRFQALLLDQKPFLVPMLFLLACWLPFWMIYFPGSAMWDMFRQFSTYFGVIPWSDHDPILSTFIYGSLLRAGRLLGSDGLGIFFCTLYQHLLLSSCMAYSIFSMKKWGVGLSKRFLTLLFYAFCPIIALWPSSAMKDCTGFALFLLFGVLMINFVRKAHRGTAIGRSLVYLAVVGIITSLIRHDALYACVLAMLLTFLLKMPFKKRAACLMAALVVFFSSTTISNILISATNAQKGSPAEALSIPFQQTARYVKEHGDEVTEDERAAIDAVLDYDRLSELYDPDKSDNVKATYRGDDDALPEYFITWFKMFLKHPITYIEATLCNTYSYYYPNGESTDKILVHAVIAKDPEVHADFFDIDYAFDLNHVRNTILYGYLFLVKNLPGVGMTIHAGAYTWIILLGIAYAIHKKKPHILFGFIPAILNIFVCICSPVNGYFRYFIPTILLTPIAIFWMRHEIRSEGEWVN